MNKEIQKILDSLNGDGSVMIPAGWYFIDLEIPLGVIVYGYSATTNVNHKTKNSNG